jgi:eukaryotic-like serine/threonine-protein kinase
MTAGLQTEKTIFLEAVEIASSTERAAFLEQACGNDRQLRVAVEALLSSHQQSHGILDTTAVQITEHPGTQIGPYKLLQQIGEGGMGVVYMAEQTAPVKRKVALKLIKAGMDSRPIIARFEAERQALALMDHVNIARVIDAGTTESGRPYFVMDLVHGVPITKYCDDSNLTPRQRMELFLPVCQAIQHAHQKGIIHRDIKPSNVMVTLYDGKPVPKVIDFGVAKATQQKLIEETLFTQYGSVVGTLEYMSPEQAELSALGVDTRTDIYSLGVLLYELLTGNTPLGHKRVKDAAFAEILRLIREEEPSKPSTRLSESGDALASISAHRQMEPLKLTKLLRGELDWIVMKALEKDRNRRYESASALAGDVGHHLADEPVQACPPSAWYRLRKFSRRYKATLATGAVVACALFVAVSALLVSNIRIRSESGEKTKALDAATASQREAQESLKDALAAVDQMLTRVSEERLQYTPQMEPLRQELLHDALKFYQKFLERRGQDPAIRRETALAYRRMGSLHYRLGDYRQAEDAYRRAFAMLDQLDAESPLERDVLSQMILSLIDFSWVLRTQGKDEEEKALRRAAEIAEGLVKESPNVPVYRELLVDASNRLAGLIAKTQPEEAEKILNRNLILVEELNSFWHRAHTHHNLGRLRAWQRRFAESEDSQRHAAELFEKAAAESPAQRWVEVDLAETLAQLAFVISANGRHQEAEEICRRAIRLCDQLAADFPAGPHYRWGQARAHSQHASYLRTLNRPAEAEQAYRRALDLSEKLADDFPDLPGYQWTALDRHRALAVFLVETGRAHELEIDEKAVRRFEQLTVAEKSQALKWRGHFYAGREEWEKAADDLEQVIEFGSDDVVGVWYPLAVLHLRNGRTAQYRSLCERLLEQPALVEKGKHFVVIICKLAPDAVADLSRPVQIAEGLVAGEPANAEYVGLLGDALYRRGNLDAAVAKLEAGIRTDTKSFGVYWRKLVLAMAYQRLGRGAEAQPLFQEVAHWMKEAPVSWTQRLDLQLLHDEAEGVLKQAQGLTQEGT